jgi:hypothetical protein
MKKVEIRFRNNIQQLCYFYNKTASFMEQNNPIVGAGNYWSNHEMFT